MEQVLSLQPVSKAAKRRFVEAGDTTNLPSSLRRCWERVRPMVDPGQIETHPVLAESEMRLRSESLEPWLRTLPDAVRAAWEDLGVEGHVLAFADADAVVLARIAGPAIADAADEVGIVAGSVWQEGIKGTNAIGTGLVEQRPVSVHGAAHFSRSFHGFSCHAAPVFDLRGDLLGVVDATTVAPRRKPHGWQRLTQAVLHWERLVRALAGPEDSLLPLSQLRRMAQRFRVPSFVFGPRGTVRLALERDQARTASWVQDRWNQVIEAVAGGQEQIQTAQHKLSLEPFHDADGRLVEVMVFVERSSTSRVHSVAPVTTQDPWSTTPAPISRPSKLATAHEGWPRRRCRSPCCLRPARARSSWLGRSISTVRPRGARSSRSTARPCPAA